MSLAIWHPLEVNFDQPTQTEKSGHALSHFRNNGSSPNVVSGIQSLSDRQIYFFVIATVPSLGEIRNNHFDSKCKKKKMFLFDFIPKRPLKQAHESAVSNHLITFLIFCRNILYHCTVTRHSSHMFVTFVWITRMDLMITAVIISWSKWLQVFHIVFLSSSPETLAWFIDPVMSPPSPPVSLLPKIEADDWEPPAPLCLLYLRHCLIITTLPAGFTWCVISTVGVPKWMHTNIGSTFPNKGPCVEVLGSGHSSVIRESKVSVSTSLLLYLNPLYHTGENVCVWDCFCPL